VKCPNDIIGHSRLLQQNRHETDMPYESDHGVSMSTFGRTFPIEKITGEVLEENPWLKDMLGAWRPAGDAVHRDMTEAPKLISRSQTLEEDLGRLRLAIRNGHLNFYRGGQSVAKIGFDSGGRLQFRIHSKYVYGETGRSDKYVTLTSAGLPDQATRELREYRGLAELKGWVANANKHVGKEKRFVDSVVARNPHTIDLEMALPAYSKERKAPRMDLVALEPVGDCWRIVFWEAKLVDDPRLRCRGDNVSPKVVQQLAQYTSWLGHPNHLCLVAHAYQNTCRLLVEFRELAKRFNPEIEELGPGIVAAAAADVSSLLVDVKPRLLIYNDPENIPFIRDRHLQKLRSAPHNIHVQMVNGPDDMALEARL
jgi:hypothetical protein